jgi:hypothetical protein
MPQYTLTQHNIKIKNSSTPETNKQYFQRHKINSTRKLFFSLGTNKATEIGTKKETIHISIQNIVQ